MFVFWFLVLPLIHSFRFYNRGAISSFAYNPYELPKFWWFVGGAWLLGAVGAWEILGNKENKGEKGNFDRLTALVLIYILIAFVSDLLGLDPRTSILGSYWRHQGWITSAAGILLFLILRLTAFTGSVYRNHRNRSGIGFLLTNRYWPVLVSAFLVSAFALWQGIRFYFFKDLTVPNYDGRIVGTMGNPNFLGGWLAMVLPLVLWQADREGKAVRWGVKIILGLMILAAIFLSFSRGAWLAVMAVGLSWLVVKKKFKVLAGLLISGLILVVLSIETQQAGPLQFLTRDSIWESRLLIWEEGIKAAVKRPVLGYGQENFGLVFPAKYQMRVDSAHNLFLEILLSSGIVGLVAYWLILIEAFKKASFAVCLSLLAFLIRAQFNPLFIPEIAFFWYLLTFQE